MLSVPNASHWVGRSRDGPRRIWHGPGHTAGAIASGPNRPLCHQNNAGHENAEHHDYKGDYHTPTNLAPRLSGPSVPM